MSIETLISEKQWGYLTRRYHLTPRELQVSKLICKGHSNHKIAENLHRTPNTVKIHTRNIYRKVEVHNKISLLLKFYETEQL